MMRATLFAMLLLAAPGASADCAGATLTLIQPNLLVTETRQIRTFGDITLGAAKSVGMDGSGAFADTGHITIQCPTEYRGSFDFACPFGADGWGVEYVVPASGVPSGNVYPPNSADPHDFDSDGTVQASEFMEALTAAADVACKLDNNFELMTSLTTDDMNTAVMRCDKNSLTPGVSLGTMFPILHDGTTADDDSVTDASGGKAAGDAIGVGVAPLDIFSQTEYFASSYYPDYVAPSRLGLEDPYPGAVNHGVEQGTMNIPTGPSAGTAWTYSDGAAATLGLEAPLVQAVDGVAASAMLRSSRPLQGGGARMWKQMAAQATGNGACQ